MIVEYEIQYEGPCHLIEQLKGDLAHQGCQVSLTQPSSEGIVTEVMSVRGTSEAIQAGVDAFNRLGHPARVFIIR